VGAHITFCKATPCTTPVTGTNRLAATTDSGAAGFFVLRTVPDGSLYMKVDQTGYQTQTLGPFTFDHLLGPISPINVRLEPVVHKVQITVKRTWSNNDLSTATVKLDNGGLPISADVFALSGGDYVATFNQVKWGCWTVTLGLPADHYGVQGPLTGGPTDTNVTGCTGPKQLVVPTTEGTAPATASMVLDEGRVDVTVAATARADFPGHVAPASVQLLITKSGTPGWTIPFTVGSRTLWLPPGSGYAMTARRLPVDAFWPDDTKTAITVPAAKPTADAVLVPLALTEGAATLTVKLTGQRLDLNTLVLTPPTTESVPTSFSTAAFTADSTSFDLPKGVWTVKAISTKSVTDPDTGAVTVTTKEDTGSATITGPGPTSVTLNLH
jgi:large repetitive protein